MRTPPLCVATDQRREMTPTKETLKVQAKRLRSHLQQSGVQMTHSQCLELLARQMGHRDWNTLSAACPTDTAPPGVGDRVRGTYLGQPFTGVVKGLSKLTAAGRWRITVVFDAPVDVVRFDSFSALRQQLTVIVDAAGTALRATSDGEPHLTLAGPGP